MEPHGDNHTSDIVELVVEDHEWRPSARTGSFCKVGAHTDARASPAESNEAASRLVREKVTNGAVAIE